MSNSVLILGINDRAALALVRYLGRNEIPVHILCYRDSKITLSSKYIIDFYEVTSPAISVSKCLNETYKIIEKVRPEKIIPINDVWCTLTSNFKKPYISRVQLNFENYFLLSNKWESLNYLKNIGLKVPNSHYIQSEEDIEGLQLNFSKFIIKPIYSVRLVNDRIIQTKVRSANSKQQLVSIVRECIGICPVIIQERVSGKGFGLNILARTGQLELFGITERLIEPKSGGASSYRTNRQGFKDLEKISHSIVENLQVSGIFMIELKVGESAYFMEINFRPWGSISTQLNAGNNFFSFYHQDGSYRQKKVFQTNLRRELERILRLDRLSIKHSFNRTFRIIIGKEKFDEFALDDCMPFFSVFTVVLKNVLSKIRGKYLRIQWSAFPILEKLEEDIMFICNGNINRSAFAASYSRNYFGINVKSAGIISLEGRSIGYEYKRFGRYLLDGHLSSHVDKYLDNYNYKYVVFDKRQVKYLLTKGAKPSSIVRFSINEVKDPYGLSEKECDSIFESIISVINGLRV